jgi:hypothetical protein
MSQGQGFKGLLYIISLDLVGNSTALRLMHALTAFRNLHRHQDSLLAGIIAIAWLSE